MAGLSDGEIFALQPALDGLAVRSRKLSHAVKAKKDADNAPAHKLPIARVVLDVQTAHLGGFFDYIVPEKFSKVAQPGTMVRVRFGAKRHTGIIWQRCETSEALYSSLKAIELVLGKQPQMSSSLRRDVDAIAQYFGGSRANIVRLAVPPRVAKVEQEMSALVRAVRRSETDVRQNEVAESALIRKTEEITQSYEGGNELSQLIGTSRIENQIVWDLLPGATRWCDDLAWAALSAVRSGRQVAIILPDMRQVADMAYALERLGATEFAYDDERGTWRGDYAVLNASLSSTHRYRSYMAVAQGLVGCVIGTRAAMYAPVADGSLFITFHEDVYQNWDGFTPYPNVRDVVNIRARRGNSLVIHSGFARSPRTQWDADQHHTILQVTPYPFAVNNTLAWIRHLNREELERLADPAVGARIPSTAVHALRKAALNGPVLLSIPARSRSQVLCCASCRKLATCRRCLGPLMMSQTTNGKPQCQWCGQVAMDWSCQHCAHTQMRLLHVGTEGTASELSTLIPGVPVIVSTPAQPRGVVEEIANRPSLVIATPGHEPRVRDRETGSFVSYASVALIDAWTSLYGSSLDRRLDVMTNWMRAAALCASRENGGQVLILGETEQVMAHTLVMWNPQILSAQEVNEAQETALPPSVTAAVVWGEKFAVDQMIKDAVRELGSLPTVQTAQGEVPSLLGPVPKAVPQIARQNYIDGMNERVQCVLRVPHNMREKLTAALQHASARHSAQRNAQELHFHINPKNLL